MENIEAHLEQRKPFTEAGFTENQANLLSAGFIGLDARMDGLQHEVAAVKAELSKLPWRMFSLVAGLLAAQGALLIGVMYFMISTLLGK